MPQQFTPLRCANCEQPTVTPRLFESGRIELRSITGEAVSFLSTNPEQDARLIAENASQLGAKVQRLCARGACPPLRDRLN